ncbi:MAG: non-heme iron oxygenase ferredoxin subunit [Elusimicrobia bacterium]|nr:non-heme iron oxygenase ferredoxin subunit [Elusimicrobiota bacterium]
MASKIKLAPESAIKEGQTYVYDVLENKKKVALRRLDGKIYAFEDRCSHDDGELASGPVLENCMIECPRHGARFNIKTGKVLRMPAVVDIETYPVNIKEGDVWIEMPADAG